MSAQELRECWYSKNLNEVPAEAMLEFCKAHSRFFSGSSRPKLLGLWRLKQAQATGFVWK